MTAALLGVLLGFIGSMPVAGPIALLVVRKGLKGRYDEGAAVALGASVPEAVYCGMALLGFDFLFERYPVVSSASQVIGAIMLLMLGFAFALMKPTDAEQDLELPKRNAKAAPFITGFTVAALNPTLIATWSGVAAVLYATVGPFSDLEKLFFPVGVGLGNFLWFAVLLSLMQRHSARFSPAGVTRIIRVIGVVVIAFGVWLLVRSV